MKKLILDLSNFKISKHQNIIKTIEGNGYSFHLLQDLLCEADFERKLFELVQEGVLKSPQSDGDFESYDAFCEKLLQRCYIDVADGFVIAKFDDEWIGLTGITIEESTGVGQSGLTVVKREHQGQGIAKVLKLKSLEQAVSLGAASVVTENHVSNYPMLAINRFLGFENYD